MPPAELPRFPTSLALCICMLPADPPARPRPPCLQCPELRNNIPVVEIYPSDPKAEPIRRREDCQIQSAQYAEIWREVLAKYLGPVPDEVGGRAQARCVDVHERGGRPVAAWWQGVGAWLGEGRPC